MINFLVGAVVGLFLGASIGVVLMACLQINRIRKVK